MTASTSEFSRGVARPVYRNLCSTHREISRRNGNRTALRFKRDGVFRNVSWSDYRRTADRAALALMRLGIDSGDRVAILSENRVEWLIADHAMLSAGAITVPLHAPLSARQVQYQLSHSQSRGVIVSGQDQADKVIEVADELPDLEFLCAFEPISGVPDRLRTVTWNEVVHTAAFTADAARTITDRESSLSTDSPATIIYTSGTTGNPKGVLLSHGNLLSNAVTIAGIADFSADDIMLSWLPYSHIYARTVDHYLSTSVVATVCVAESPDTLIDDLKLINPTWMTAVPRFYEKIWSIVESLPVDERRRQLRHIFGPRLRELTSGGAPLPDHIAEGFFECDIPLHQGYGLTESSPVISFNTSKESMIGSVGRPIPDVEVRIADDGEILTRGPHVMQGYWRNDEATREAVVDGWLYTGDIGRLDDGYVIITDRKKDIIVTSGGKNVSPSEIERLLISDPHIDQAVVYGDDRPFLTALIVPNFQLLAQAVPQYNGDEPDDEVFISSEPVTAFLEARVADVMQAVSRPEQVRKFLVLSRPLTLADDELTATLKVRRAHVIAKFRSRLDAMYEANDN